MTIKNSFKMVAVGAVLASMGAVGTARAQDVSVNGNVSGTVNSKFTITLDVAAVSFGFVDPGTTTDLLLANTATCKTNHNTTWYLKLKYLAAVSDATLATKSSGGLGINQTAFTGMTAVDQTTYTSAASEKTNLPNGTAIALDYEMVADANAVPGLKSWTVVYTMSETL